MRPPRTVLLRRLRRAGAAAALIAPGTWLVMLAARSYADPSLRVALEGLLSLCGH